jgi:putative transposase
MWRGIEGRHETVRFWWQRFGPIFAAEIRQKRRQALCSGSRWHWYRDEVFVKVNGVRHHLSRAVDHEGKVPTRFHSTASDLPRWC